MWDEVEEYLVGEKVYFDTAVINDKISKEQFLRILKNHGSERILFASDSPWSSQKRCCQWLEEMELLPKDKENIMYKNAERLLFLNS